MSTKQASIPDATTAYANLFNGVHQKVFFGRCSSSGYSPMNEKEASDMLLLAARLRQADEDEKQAGDSRYDEPLSALDSVLFGGTDKSAFYQEEDMAIKQAAAEWAKDPTIYNSVLSLKAYEASVMASQQNQ